MRMGFFTLRIRGRIRLVSGVEASVGGGWSSGGCVRVRGSEGGSCDGKGSVMARATDGWMFDGQMVG